MSDLALCYLPQPYIIPSTAYPTLIKRLTVLKPEGWEEKQFDNVIFLPPTEAQKMQSWGFGQMRQVKSLWWS